MAIVREGFHRRPWGCEGRRDDGIIPEATCSLPRTFAFTNRRESALQGAGDAVRGRSAEPIDHSCHGLHIPVEKDRMRHGEL